MSKLMRVMATLLCLFLVVSLFVACEDKEGIDENQSQTATDSKSEESISSAQGSNNTEQENTGIGNQGVETTASVIEGASGEGLLFELNEDGKSYTCVGIGTCTDAKIVIDTYEGLPVTSIGERAFYACDSLTSITIADSVTDIGYRAFTNCESLTSITIGNGITSIGIEMFRGCESLTSVAIPDSVTSILSCAFEDCTSLTSLTIPNGVTSIGNCAFENCTALTSITIPNSVTGIDFKAFEDCNSLTDVYFTGTEDEWNAIGKSDALIPSTATIHFNYTP